MGPASPVCVPAEHQAVWRVPVALCSPPNGLRLPSPKMPWNPRPRGTVPLPHFLQGGATGRQRQASGWNSQGALCHTAGFPLCSHCGAPRSSAGHCEVHIKKEAPREVRAALEWQQGAVEWQRGSRNGEGSATGEGSVLPP